MHLNMRVLWGLFFILICRNTYAQTDLNFVVPSFTPYTYSNEEGEVIGIAIDMVSTILDDMGVGYTIELVPNYGRAVEEAKSGRKDGFFLASKNAERDGFAVFSEPVTENRWSWFLPANSTLDPTSDAFKTEAKIGTQINTNTHKWLKSNEYTISAAPSKVLALPEMVFRRNRADAVFLAEAVFVDNADKNGISPNEYKQVVQIVKPFGMYITNAYLEKNPGFMEKLNASIQRFKQSN